MDMDRLPRMFLCVWVGHSRPVGPHVLQSSGGPGGEGYPEGLRRVEQPRAGPQQLGTHHPPPQQQPTMSNFLELNPQSTPGFLVLSSSRRRLLRIAIPQTAIPGRRREAGGREELSLGGTRHQKVGGSGCPSGAP